MTSIKQSIFKMKLGVAVLPELGFSSQTEVRELLRMAHHVLAEIKQNSATRLQNFVPKRPGREDT